MQLSAEVQTQVFYSISIFTYSSLFFKDLNFFSALYILLRYSVAENVLLLNVLCFIGVNNETLKNVVSLLSFN